MNIELNSNSARRKSWLPFSVFCDHFNSFLYLLCFWWRSTPIWIYLDFSDTKWPFIKKRFVPWYQQRKFYFLLGAYCHAIRRYLFDNRLWKKNCMLTAFLPFTPNLSEVGVFLFSCMNFYLEQKDEFFYVGFSGVFLTRPFIFVRWKGTIFLRFWFPLCRYSCLNT